METILRVEDLAFTYDKEKFVLKDIDMEFKKGIVYGCSYAFRFLLSCMGDENSDFKIEELLKLDGETI